ncbi:MAG: hypothetical protein RSB74_01660 [Kiritimatiellia bacterium]
MDVSYFCRRMREIGTSGGYEDPDGLLACTEAELRWLKRNPFISEGEDEPIACMACCDKTVVGRDFLFPLGVVYRNQRLLVSSGSSLWVSPLGRQHGVGLEIPEQVLQMGIGGRSIASCLSQLAVPVHEMAGFEIWRSPRHILLRHTRSLVEMRFRGIIGACVAKVADGALALFRGVLRVIESGMLRGFTVEETATWEDALDRCVSAENEPFREDHGRAWFDWAKTCRKSQGAHEDFRLFNVRRKGQIVGFFLLRTRFYEQASSRGFRNLFLTTVMEWGSVEPTLGEKALFALALRQIDPIVDAVECVPNEPATRRWLWRRLALPVGDYIYTVAQSADAKEPLEGFTERKNWRLRPAFGDATFF